MAVAHHAPAPSDESYLAGSGLWGWLTTVDHKRIAVLYGLTALVFLFVGGIEALLMRLQLARPDNTFLGAAQYNALFTMHGTTMIFLVVMPLELGLFANFAVPLLIGARDVAFPRLNALSYWVFLAGALLLHASFLFGGAPDAGWFGYANLTERLYSPGTPLDFWVVGLLILGASTLMSGINFAVTIVNLRAPGMTFMRMPIFVWTVLVTSVLILLAFPALTVGLVLLFMDRFLGTHFYVATMGASPILWQHLFWLFGHPEVYIMALPAFGIVSEVVPVFSRKPLYGYPMMAYSTALIGFLSYGVWGHHMFAVGMGPAADSAFAITSMLIAIPTGIKIFTWIATLWGGQLRFTTAFLFALGLIVEFTIGGLSGVMHAAVPIDLQQTDSYFVVAHLHYVLFGGAVFGILSALFYWWPKITGTLLDERLGKLQFWLTIVGFNGTFFPMHFLGAEGMPRRIYRYAPGLGWDVWNLVATVSAFVLALSFAVLLGNLWRTWRRRPAAPADPWDGRTLEWWAPSPPPEHNFARVPLVRARDAFWGLKYGRRSDGRAPVPLRPSLEPAPPDTICVPVPSILPPLVGAGLVLAGIGMLTRPAASVIGLAAVLLGVLGFAFERPAFGEPQAGRPAVAGVDDRKLGVWAFVGSESIFFASLISTYLVYKGHDVSGPSARQILEVPLTSVSTFVLLMSSLLMVLALAAVERGAVRASRAWLLGTAALGLVFLGGQAYEFTHFYHEGVALQTNLFSQTFYTLVGFHGLHVAIGVIWLLALAGASLAGRLPHERRLAVELCGIYWHFVDVVWIVIFTLVYLLEGVRGA
ncbi:MAG TPA: cytochrome c oxidase subunit I [Candidatus Binatia bacterium]|nr:cytochrome c oxidase subunit I [Candidatus Binatia bacterium]